MDQKKPKARNSSYHLFLPFAFFFFFNNKKPQKLAENPIFIVF